MSDNATFAAFEKKRPFMIILGYIIAFMVGLGYTWAVVQAPIVKAMGGEEKLATVVLVYTFNVLCATMSPTILGGFTKHLKVNQMMIIGGILFGGGYLGSAYIHSIPLLFLFFGVGTGVGTGFTYPVLMGYAATIYPEKTGTITGLMAGIYGGSAAIWCPIMASMIESKDLSATFTILGILCLVLIIGAGLLLKPAPEGFVEYKKSTMATTATAAKSGAAKAPTVKSLHRGEMVRQPMFYIAAFAFAFGLASGMMVITQASRILQASHGMTPVEAAKYVSLFSLMSMAGRIVWGAVTDRTDKYVTLCIICLLPVIMMGILSTSPSVSIAIFCMAVTALCYGGFGGTLTPITADLFGPLYITENYGVMYLMFGIAGFVGPRLAVSLSNGGDYSKAFMAACVLAIVSFISSVIVRKKVKAGN